ncbi:hypothetical protein VDG1235_3528 [Verrucomicrobiia bacterium DG1235]|nr:hypothetical protein VDG1235_3528 [Verrucomicrobiae bacterium DG1235]
MNLKILSISTLVLAVLATITYFVKNADNSAPQDPRVGQAIIANEALNSVTTFEMISGNESMTFVKDDASAQWLLQEQYNLPANAKQIADLITQLKDAKLERVASTNPARIADFGFGIDYINLLNANGDSVLSLDLGRETDSGKQLVRYGQENVAFIANDAFTVNGDPTSWLDKTLLEISRDDIRSAAFTLPDGQTLAVSRESDTADWTTSDPLPAGKQLDQGAITRALNRFAKVSFTSLADLTDPEALAAKANSRSLSLTLADSSSYDITLGRRPEVRVMKDVETTNDAGETVTEQREDVETPAGPVFISIKSAKTDDPINEYMTRTAYQAGAFLFTNMPQTLDSLLADAPEPEPEPTPTTPTE